MATEKNIKLYWYCFSILILLLAGCDCLKQIVLDETLVTNSQKWEAKRNGGILSMGKVQFGPYKTTSYTKLDSTSKNKIVSGDFHGLHLSRHNQKKEKRKVYTLNIAQDTITAKVLLHLWFKTEISKAGLFNSNGNQTLSDLKDAEGEIAILQNSWLFNVESFGIDPMNPNDIFAKTSGYLIHNKDTLTISSVTEFTDKKAAFGGVLTKGIKISHHKQTIAALQLMGRYYIWIENSIDNETKLAIAALFATILGSKDL